MAAAADLTSHRNYSPLYWSFVWPCLSKLVLFIFGNTDSQHYTQLTEESIPTTALPHNIPDSNWCSNFWYLGTSLTILLRGWLTTRNVNSSFKLDGGAWRQNVNCGCVELRVTLKCCWGNFPILRLVPGARWPLVVCPPLIKSPGEDNEGGEGHSVPVSRAVNQPSGIFTVPGEGSY